MKPILAFTCLFVVISAWAQSPRKRVIYEYKKFNPEKNEAIPHCVKLQAKWLCSKYKDYANDIALLS